MFFVIVLSPTFVMGVCKTDSIAATTPTNRFTINNDGTVIDTQTGLTWKRCSEGQSGIDCNIGNANSYTWQGALKQVQNVNDNGGFAGYKNWRLPNIKELSSIIEYQCSDPSINLVVFPNTSSFGYWSSSPNAYDYRSKAWYVFFNVPAIRSDESYDLFVRLVR
jgi:hypothetical protein